MTMAITKRTVKPSQNADNFITGAPDGSAKVSGVKKGNKRQISLTIAPELLMKVDQLAADLGQSRAGLINMAIYRAVEHGLVIDGLRKG